MLIIRQLITINQNRGNRSYHVNAIDAQKDAYEEAKNDIIFGILHIHPDMDRIANHNRNEIAKSNASWPAHNAIMTANQAAFNA